MVEIPGSPLNVTAGTQVYVIVFTTDANWSEKMVVHDCYSEPASGSPSNRRYDLIRNGYVLIDFFAYCKGGNFKIHIWAWFDYFIC